MRAWFFYNIQPLKDVRDDLNALARDSILNFRVGIRCHVNG